jgi:hypothetical protein
VLLLLLLLELRAPSLTLLGRQVEAVEMVGQAATEVAYHRALVQRLTKVLHRPDLGVCGQQTKKKKKRKRFNVTVRNRAAHDTTRHDQRRYR